MKSAIIKVEDKDVLGSLRKLLAQLLESEFLDALLVPRMLPSEDGFAQSLVKDVSMLEYANPLAPTMAVQSAQMLSDLTSTPFEGRIGVVLKPCELRAVVELTKFLQVKLENVVTIGVDCLGTYEVRDYAKMVASTVASPLSGDSDNGGFSSEAFLEGVKNGEIKAVEDYNFRNSCQICEYPVPLNADITFGFWGCDPTEEIVVMVGARFEDELKEKLSLELQEEDLADREKVTQKIIDGRKQERDKVISELREQTNSMEKLMQTLSTCIRCHNCMNVCPICYCKECLFKSSIFEHRSDQFLKWADRRGAIRMPTDTLMFHLTRMNHMATSCVSCGMCDSACPNQLPISSLFKLIGSELQEMFEYVPGRDIEEEPPVSIFQESELQAETGTGN